MAPNSTCKLRNIALFFSVEVDRCLCTSLYVAFQRKHDASNPFILFCFILILNNLFSSNTHNDNACQVSRPKNLSP
jgi:hypothetical protein